MLKGGRSAAAQVVGGYRLPVGFAVMTGIHQPIAPDGAEFAALIFDWDGTLVDSREICFSALSRALAEVGVTLDPEWYWPRQAIASPDLLQLWQQQFGWLPEPIDEIIVRCRTYVMAAAPHLVVLDDQVRVARAARARGQRLAIGSNASTNTVVAGLTATGLAGLFDTVVTWSDVPSGRGKPAPDIFLLAAQQLDVPTSRCLVYEDTDDGVNAALAGGMSAYNVRTRHLWRI
jgi:beta-phosphoglucomutase-like phosphatase (HAD superfamily)